MRRRFRVALIVLTLFAAAALVGCGQEEPQGDRRKPEGSESGRGPGGPATTAEAPEPVGLGETAEVGPFAVTLNAATQRSVDGGQDGSSGGESRHYAVVDLTLENRAREPADVSGTDYLLRDGQGYSFELESVPDQRPRPEGQVEPGDKASGEVAFELGAQPADGRLELSISLPEQPEARAAYFEFVAEKEQEEPEPKPVTAEKKEDLAPSVKPGYSLVEDPSGSLSVEVPPSWNSQTGTDSEGEGGESSWSYYAGEYLSASITTARSLDAWYGGPVDSEGSGAYMVASESLAQSYTDDELIYSLLHQKKETNCTAGPSQNIDRPPYSGTVQTWFDCNGVGTTYYVFAAAPEGRACVVVGGARTVRGAAEADQDAVQHIVDNFEVDCGSLPPSAPLQSSATASATASASPEATASRSASASQSAGTEIKTASCGDFQTMSGEPSQWQAQQYYDFVATPEEKAILDPDGDGFACEDLEPSADGTDADGGSSATPDPDDNSPDPGMPAPEGPSTAPPDSSGPTSCDGVNGPIPTPPGDPDGLDGDGDGEACE